MTRERPKWQALFRGMALVPRKERVVMTIEKQKEAFSRAYVRAIASVAGYGCSVPEDDNESIDISFRSGTNPSFVTIDTQLKATSRAEVVKEKEIHFPLSIKNYDDLRTTNTMALRILIVLILPNDGDLPEKWINQTSDQLALMKCAYWTSLYGCPSTNNTNTITITIPMDETHMFTPKALNDIGAQIISSIVRR